jgi:hypothetical protein
MEWQWHASAINSPLVGSITFFACEDLASCSKISQITHFSCVFSGKKILAHGESKT